MLLENACIYTEVAPTLICHDIQGEAFETGSFSCLLTWGWSDLVSFQEFSVLPCLGFPHLQSASRATSPKAQYVCAGRVA